MALLHRPRLLIADEPTSALDPITRAEVISLLRELNRDMNIAILFISHELLLVASLCRRVAILQKGEIVESGSAEEIFYDPQHPYTRALIGALPVKLPSVNVDFRTAQNRTETFVVDLSVPSRRRTVRE
jgi:ABC-type dipeptide/oligopeptide/nickel transport system ATPase component